MRTAASLPVGSPQIANDLEGVVLAHGLSVGERSMLAAIVVGAVTGNRDLPLYRLTRAIGRVCRSIPTAAAGGAIGLIGYLLVERDPAMPRLSTALLDFLLSMDGFAEVEAIEAAVAPLLAEPGSEAAMRDCANGFARALYRYRSRHLPSERNRAKFADLRRYLGADGARARHIEDGDALDFWVDFGSRESWTLYETVLDGMVAYCLAEEECRAAAPVGGGPLDEDGETMVLWERCERQAIASTDLGESLAEAVAAFEEMPLKVFKEVELQPIRKLARLGRFAQVWPRSSLGLMAFAPCQASIVQLVKDRAPSERLAEVAECAAAADYRDVIATTAGYARTLDEVAALADAVGGDENGPRPSTEQTIPSAKDFPLMRRKSFKAMPAADLAAALDGLREPQQSLKSFLDRVVRHWSARFDKTAEENSARDRGRFSAKLRSLYLSGAEVNHG